MIKDDLLILDIGRSFLFSSYLKFSKGSGYSLVSDSKYARYPKQEDINDVIDQYLELLGYGEKENVLCLVDEKDHFLEIKYDTSIQNHTYWKKHIIKLEKELGIKGIGFLDVSANSLTLATNSKLETVELDPLKLDIFGDNLKLIKKLGIDKFQLINFLFGPAPLPQQISDFHKSYLLSYIIGSVFANKLKFEGLSFLIISSEWFKSGFLDKSAFITAINKYNKSLCYFSFDREGVWELLLNDGLEEYKDLKYLNKVRFYPEFTLINLKRTRDLEKVFFLGENGERKTIITTPDIQLFIPNSGVGFLQKHDKSIFNNIIINPQSIDIKKIFNIEKFKHWYTFYKYKEFSFVRMKYKEKYIHEIKVETDFSKVIKNTADFAQHYYDLFSLGQDISKELICVTQGEVVSQGQLLAKRDHLGGVLINKLNSKYDGIVNSINLDKGWIIIGRDFSKDNDEENTNFDFQIVKSLGRNKMLIKVFGRKLYAGKIYGKDKLSILNKFDKDKERDYVGSTVWMESLEDVFFLLEHISLYQPAGIIIPGLDDKLFDKLFLGSRRYLEVMNIIILNDFKKTEYTRKQKKFLELNSGKAVFIHPKFDTIYFLDKKGKFSSEQAPYAAYFYNKVYSFDDWNYEGEVIYNDADSRILRTSSGAVLDIANYNLINFNENE